MAEIGPDPPSARFAFRGAADVAAALGAAYGVAPPMQACRAAEADGRAALWLGPDEWLLLAPAAHLSRLRDALPKALASLPHSLVEISDRDHGMTITGADAAELLAHGCPLDLTAGAFPVNACTRTVFGKAEIVLWRVAPHGFRLEARRSLMGYVQGLLAHALTSPSSTSGG